METNQIQRVLEYFEGETGKLHYLELLQATQRMIQRREWCTTDGAMPDGRNSKDVLEDIIKAVLSDPTEKGHRTIKDDVGVEPALIMIIRSVVNHAAESLENRSRRKTPAQDIHGNTVFDTSAGMWQSSSDELSPEEQNTLRQRCDIFIEFVKKDQIVHSMLLLIKNKGLDRPAEAIAKELKISVIEVYNARKRLDTFVRKFTQPLK